MVSSEIGVSVDVEELVGDEGGMGEKEGSGTDVEDV